MPTTGTTSADVKTGISYEIGILETDFKEDYNQTTSGTTAVCTVDFDSAGAWLHEMLGYSSRDGIYLKRVLPEKCSWNDNQYAMSAQLLRSLTPAGFDANGWTNYEKCVYAVQFAAPLYTILDDQETGGAEYKRFVVWTRSGQATNVKIPGASYVFPSDSKPLEEVGVMTGGTTSLEAKWLDVPYVNIAMFQTLLNKVNTSAVTWDGVEYAAETVLFQSWKEQKKVNPFGRLTADLTFNFVIRSDKRGSTARTWNTFWRKSATGGITLEAPTADGTVGGSKVFEAADLNSCFSFA